ncbi:MAG: hypothetical protein K6C34_03395, partial [Alphaproteobacteria bacterium]|nr:hypothetical protein [Alphaproteobacteria bacterium]
QRYRKIQTSFCAKNRCLSIQVNTQNYDEVMAFITSLKQADIPLCVLQKISKLCAENKIRTEQLSYENGIAKIKTQLNKKEIKKLLRNKLITIEKNLSAENEFENLLEDKKFEVVICIKIN